MFGRHHIQRISRIGVEASCHHVKYPLGYAFVKIFKVPFSSFPFPFLFIFSPHFFFFFFFLSGHWSNFPGAVVCDKGGDVLISN
jgi:hypothetical protein